MSEGLMAYNNISSGSDTGVKKITETKMIESGAEYTFGTDNHKQMTYKSLITFSGPTNAILIKIEIPSYSLYCYDCKAYDSYPCNSFEGNTYVRYGGTSDITSASISIWKNQSGNVQSISKSFSPPSTASYTITCGIYGGGNAFRSEAYMRLTSPFIVTMSYLVYDL